MTVKELIEKLKQTDEDKEVKIFAMISAGGDDIGAEPVLCEIDDDDTIDDFDVVQINCHEEICEELS